MLPTPFHAKEEGGTPLHLRLLLFASLPVVFSPQLQPVVGANKYARSIVVTKALVDAALASSRDQPERDTKTQSSQQHLPRHACSLS
ncbi:hypothetical protein LX36DRAFT_651033 [Colletotrichum falcatum]|nr:hypothetical protein LX36DRAFT_651033 [Colletotrichum falcatum]